MVFQLSFATRLKMAGVSQPTSQLEQQSRVGAAAAGGGVERKEYVVEISEVARHEFTFTMSGPAITVIVQPKHGRAQEVKTFRFVP